MHLLWHLIDGCRICHCRDSSRFHNYSNDNFFAKKGINIKSISNYTKVQMDKSAIYFEIDKIYFWDATGTHSCVSNNLPLLLNKYLG